MSLDLQTLISKLNPVCRKGLEKAAELCVSQTHYNVEIEHLLLKLLDMPDTDILRMIRYYEVEAGRVGRELTAAIDQFKRGNSRTPALSPQIIQTFEQAWLLSSLHFDSAAVRSGAILLALLDHDPLRGVILEAAPCLRKISRTTLKHDVLELVKTTEEAVSDAPRRKSDQDLDTAGAGKSPGKTNALDQYTIDLTHRARKGLIDPIQERDAEIRQIIDILTRRRQNNPILTGEAGVGKTAVVEGLAIRVIKGDVPPSLTKVSIRLLDLGLLQAGAGIKGEFEKRLKSVIEEVKSAPFPIILFIDEAHTMIGAGAPAGMGDAANMLKPALARGELRTIAATTWSEYKKYFEKDAALARRFQVVKINEPSEASAVTMLRGVAANLEAHHKVTILDEGLHDAVRLSHRYISGRQLPDKAISVLDTACARVSIGQNATPPALEDAVRRMEQLELEIKILKRELGSGMDHFEQIKALEADLDLVKEQKERLEIHWKQEADQVQRVLKLKQGLEKTLDSNSSEADIQRLQSEMAKELEALEHLQGADPMVPHCVDSRVVAQVVSNWTGIPVGKMLTDEIETVLGLREKLAERIIGQDQALDSIARRIRTYRAKLDDPGKPVGVFLLVGPSGVGKTETALALSEALYGGERNLISINMSEYQEAYTVSGLKGSPPGYVGYGKGGVLTEAVRINPYSVVLLDEVEKAHPDVMELFYQVFDKGYMEDSEGLGIDFKNTIIFLTSNVGSDIIMRAPKEADNPSGVETLREQIRPELLKYFKPAFLGRLVVVPYYPLEDEVIRGIVRLKMDRIQQRFLENHNIQLTYGDDLVAAVAARCTEVDTGARNVDHILTHYLLPDLSRDLLQRMAVAAETRKIHVYMDDDGTFGYEFTPREEEVAERENQAPESASESGPGPDTDKDRDATTPPDSQLPIIDDIKKRLQSSGRMNERKRSVKKSKRLRDLLQRL